MTKQSYENSEAFAALSDLFLKENIRKYPALPYRTVPKYTDKTTNGLTRCIIDFLRLSGYHCERTGNEGRILDTRQTVTDHMGHQRIIGSCQRIKGSGMRGTSDLKAIISGRFVAIEIKCSATRDRIRPAQIEYRKQVEQAGGVYFIATTFQNFFDWYIKKFGDGK